MASEVVPLRVSRGMFINYAYLGADPQAGICFLVDPAWELAKIEEALRDSGCRCEFILLTHSHPDHVNLADELARRLGVPVHMSRREIERYGFACRNLRAFEDGERIPFGLGEVTTLVTPGHSFGSTCFRIGRDLFTGDTLFAEGCGMCEGEGADPEALFDSLQRLKALLPPETRIHPGHSYGQAPGQTLSRILGYNIYLQFEKKADFVAYRMRPGQSGWASFR